MKYSWKVKYLFGTFVLCIACRVPCHSGPSGDKKQYPCNFLRSLLVHSNGQEPKSIAEFWRITYQQLATIPMDAKVEPVEEPIPYKKYRITLQSLHGVRVSGWLSLPVQGERPARPWPVIVTTPGYGGKQQGVMLSECQRGYAILQVFPRGQGESANSWNLGGRDKLSMNLQRPEEAYYHAAYADVIRMIDFVVSRSDLDGERIALVGTSQGGGISLAVAALDSRVKVVVAHLPFLCNFRLAAQIPGSLVKRLLDQAGCNNERSLSTLDYFDAWQLAPKVKIPVLMSAGGKDELCPMKTIISVHDRLAGKKTLKTYPDLSHTSCLDFYDQSWQWLQKHFRNHTRAELQYEK